MILVYYNENELPAILTFSETVEYLYIGRNTLLKLLHNYKGIQSGESLENKKRRLVGIYEYR